VVLHHVADLAARDAEAQADRATLERIRVEGPHQRVQAAAWIEQLARALGAEAEEAEHHAEERQEAEEDVEDEELAEHRPRLRRAEDQEPRRCSGTAGEHRRNVPERTARHALSPARRVIASRA
jgi:hypothetical protein